MVDPKKEAIRQDKHYNESEAQAGIEAIEKVIEFGVSDGFDIQDWLWEFYPEFNYGCPVGGQLWILDNRKDLLNQFKIITGFDLEAELELAIQFGDE